MVARTVTTMGLGTYDVVSNFHFHRPLGACDVVSNGESERTPGICLLVVRVACSCSTPPLLHLASVFVCARAGHYCARDFCCMEDDIIVPIALGFHSTIAVL